MANPFRTHKGFGLRLHYAAEALREYGLAPSGLAYGRVCNNRKFDDCFENHDGSAVAYAIMERVHESGDVFLGRGIKLLGGILWKDWNNLYRDGKERQLSFFGR